MSKGVNKVNEIIKKYLNRFITSLETDEDWKRNLEYRTRRKQKYNELLGRDKIDSLSKEQFAEIIRELWASLFWGNKEYPVQRVMSSVTFPELKSALIDLLYGEDTIGNRYDRFVSKVKGLGTSSVTEILCFASPNDYCIWNDKPRKVLPFLGLKTKLPPRVFKYSNINGSDYERCIEVLDEIKKLLIGNGIDNADFVITDLFMWYVFNKMPKEREPKRAIETPVIEMEIASHSDAQAILLELGNILGFETYVADPSKGYKEKTLGDLAILSEIPEEFRGIKNIENIDVIWFGSAEFYFFEVVDSIGTLNEGLHRLFQALALNAKFFVIAPKEHYHKFERYMRENPYKKFRNRYIFRSYDDLLKFFRLTKEFSSSKKEFLGD